MEARSQSVFVMCVMTVDKEIAPAVREVPLFRGGRSLGQERTVSGLLACCRVLF